MSHAPELHQDQRESHLQRENRSEFEFEAKLLQTELHSGWLVPTSPKVKEDETDFTYFIIPKSLLRSSNESRNFHLLGEVKEEPTIGLSLSTPGPQFLHFLEQGLLDICSDPAEELLAVLGMLAYEYHSREKVVIDGKTYYFDFTAEQD